MEQCSGAPRNTANNQQRPKSDLRGLSWDRKHEGYVLPTFCSRSSTVLSQCGVANKRYHQMTLFYLIVQMESTHILSGATAWPERPALIIYCQMYRCESRCMCIRLTIMTTHNPCLLCRENSVTSVRGDGRSWCTSAKGLGACMLAIA